HNKRERTRRPKSSQEERSCRRPATSADPICSMRSRGFSPLLQGGCRIRGGNMKASWRWFTIASLLVISAGTQVHGQAGNYPNRAVKIILDSAAGSPPDVALRFVADRLGQSWGQQVLVVNQPGAGGSLAARAAADSAPDGYTLYQPVLSTFVALPGPAPNIPLEVPRDFAPIGFVSQNPMFVAVVPSLGVSTLPELIALAKKR